MFAQGEKAREAEDAGADFVGGDDLADEDRRRAGPTSTSRIATPDMMATVGRLGRILGPQGKMPNPKTGTITFDIGKAVEEIKAGKFEYRTDRSGIVHVAHRQEVFDETALVENYGAVFEEILRAKPAAAKGRYIKLDHARLDDGPGHACRPVPDARPAGRPGGCADGVVRPDTARARDRRGRLTGSKTTRPGRGPGSASSRRPASGPPQGGPETTRGGE